MRTVPQAIINRDNDISTEFYIRATIEPSSIVFSSLDSSHAPAFADSNTWPGEDMPTIQQVAISPNTGKIVTFYKDGVTLKYQKEDSDDVITIDSIPAYGVPGLYGSSIFFSTGSVILTKFTIDWDLIDSNSTSPLINEDPIVAQPYLIATHAISDDLVVAINSIEGGFQASLYKNDSGWSLIATQPYRFMYHRARKFTDSDIDTFILSSRVYTAAAMFNDDIYCYVSNLATGSIEGVKWDHNTGLWGDIFMALPINIDTSQAETRINNVYVRGDSIYLCSNFRRSDEELSPNIYTTVLRSKNGLQFAMDRFSVVSNLGYRFFAIPDTSDLILASCNRISRQPLTYVFSGDDGSGSSETINPPQISGFSDNSNMAAQLSLAAGNEYLLYNNNIKHGSRTKVYIGMMTPQGYVDAIYGTYVVNKIPRSISNGRRSLSLELANNTDWKLNAMTSPYYTEMASKSSVYDNMDDLEYMYVAPNCGTLNDTFSVDFWGAEGYDDVARGWKGLSLDYKGGVESKVHSAEDVVAIRTPDIKMTLLTDDYPTISANTIHADIYGWNTPTSGSVGDTITLALWIKDAETGETSIITQEAGNWPVTWPVTGPGDYPISVDVTGLTVGDQIVYVGLVFAGDVECRICPHRVDFISGATMPWGNLTDSPWTENTSGSGVKVPGYDRPYIMFCRKPYDTFNFTVTGSFKDTIVGEITDYPVAWGLVGLAIDGSNYVCARYDRTSEAIQILKSVDRVETILAQQSPISPIGEHNDMMFEHRDGTFRVYLKDSGVWVLNLEYSWLSSDGWMSKDTINPLLTGIYGLITTPMFRIVGFDPGSDEDVTNADAIPFFGIDFSVLDDFPTSGSVSIDECIYEYDGVFKPAIIRGPSQFRQSGDGTAGHYAPPYGTGKPGLECLDFDWNKANGEYTGYVIAIDDGASYACTDTDWQVYNTTGGVVKWLRDRGRYYADGSQLGKSYHNCSNRVYLTGGLLAPTLVKGEVTYHPTNSVCRILTQGDIVCDGFSGHSGDNDATIEDLVGSVAAFAGADIDFPGDTIYDTLSVDGSELVGTQYYMSGLDLTFYFEEPATSGSIGVEADISYSINSDTVIQVALTKEDSDHFSISIVGSPSMEIFEKYTFDCVASIHKARVLFHDNFISVYVDNRWTHSIAMPGEFTYASTMGIRLINSGGTILCSDVHLTDISDWREAVYFDLQTNAKSGIESIIQERPIEAVARADGSMSIMYEPYREHIVINPHTIREHRWVEQIPPDGSSDCIVYSSLDAKTMQSEDYLNDFGFSTKIYHYPNLSTGALRAAKIQQKKFYEQREAHDISMRPNLRVEPGDVLEINYIASGTNRAVNCNLIVESTSLSIKPVSPGSSPTMVIQGRFHDE